MIVYRDMISGDEVLSDAFPLQQAMDGEEVVEGLMYCESKMVAAAGDDVDIGCGNVSLKHSYFPSVLPFPQ